MYLYLHERFSTYCVIYQNERDTHVSNIHNKISKSHINYTNKSAAAEIYLDLFVDLVLLRALIFHFLGGDKIQFAKNGSIGVLSKKKQDQQVATKRQDENFSKKISVKQA